MKIKLLLLSLIVVTLWQGCAPPKQISKESEIPAERLIKKLEGSRRKIKTFEGTGVLNIKTEELGQVKANFHVVLKKPDSIKVSIYGPFGIDLAHILVTNNKFNFYEVQENKLHIGRTNNNMLKKIFKIDLSFAELIDAFAGSVNLTDKLSRIPDDYQSSESEYFLSYKNGDGKKTNYSIDMTDLAIKEFSIENENGSKILEGVYSNFKKVKDVSVPYHTVLENEGNDQSITIDYRRIKINNEIESVAISLPNDVETIRW
ncbi:MAG: DUF4292 domain-containing protein [Melioribacteraceae bacterium]|nr:DUF4292 domain-containing protein [Melioribacteraceae bacterium]